VASGNRHSGRILLMPNGTLARSIHEMFLHNMDIYQLKITLMDVRSLILAFASGRLRECAPILLSYRRK
jgi:hypothetical protein